MGLKAQQSQTTSGCRILVRSMDRSDRSAAKGQPQHKVTWETRLGATPGPFGSASTSCAHRMAPAPCVTPQLVLGCPGPHHARALSKKLWRSNESDWTDTAHRGRMVLSSRCPCWSQDAAHDRTREPHQESLCMDVGRWWDCATVRCSSRVLR